MYLTTKPFKKFSEKALAERKEKFFNKYCMEVSTTKEIAEAL
jgi:hypothetical protein